MTLTIDHVVIYVENLEAAMHSYREAGFTVNYGGQHADGITENGLIVFADGSYLELIALVDGKSYDEAGFKGLLKSSGEGFTGYALQSDDIEGDLSRMADNGVIVGEIKAGMRARPDGQMLEWKMAQLDNGMSPFVIQDVTERDLRVPLNTENVTHANGARAIHEMLIRVANIEEAINHFGQVIGIPLINLGVARFEIGESAIVIVQADDADPAPVPSLLTLNVDDLAAKRTILHGAEFMFV